MKLLAVQITKFVDPSQPGFVEFEFVDVLGRRRRFVDKVPVVSAEDLDEHSAYPQPGSIRCEEIGRRTDRNNQVIDEIDLNQPDHIDSMDGNWRFEVHSDLLKPIDGPDPALGGDQSAP